MELNNYEAMSIIIHVIRKYSTPAYSLHFLYSQVFFKAF